VYCGRHTRTILVVRNRLFASQGLMRTLIYWDTLAGIQHPSQCLIVDYPWES